MTDLEVQPQEIPEWLSVDFFRDRLVIAGDLQLQSVQFACAKGENFASNIYRVVLDVGGGETQSLIVKSRPLGNGGFSEEFTKKFNVFPKEIRMYEYVDRFERIFHEIGQNVTFAPK